MKNSFPSLEGLPAMQEASDQVNAQFQPLRCLPVRGEMPDREPTDRKPGQILEEARAKGFQCGLSAGKSEALRMAEASLRPVLKGFAHTFQHSSGIIHALAQESAGQIVQAALEIAARILCSKVEFGHGLMRDIQSALHDRLSAAYRLAIAMHPDDRARLEQLIAAGAIEWSGQAAIQIQGDAGLAAGDIKAIVDDAPRQALEQQAYALFVDSMQRVSTK